uniref:thioredoxin n=1 Tax=Hypnea pseudomusciformis TaxID=1545697 RepID=UPI0027D9E680|nr:thioredoxin [Hypnea pseudomusciformis]WCH55105.1 thioredoxin [Hypnea pseudomusciformis]WCH55504.1 thioredoxin [Hypnea pseudomusciformis]WCH56698.1 thioredoxin [Hypnea pseudomusciformis]
MIKFVQKEEKYGDCILPVIEVNDSSFNKEVINVKRLVLVDFWAPWCGPCRMVAPVVDIIAEEYQNKIKVVKINTDENPTTATEYGIRSIPTLMIFINGRRIDTIIGAVPQTTLSNTLQKYLNRQKNQKLTNYS